LRRAGQMSGHGERRFHCYHARYVQSPIPRLTH
jgi:hypothetical protein